MNKIELRKYIYNEFLKKLAERLKETTRFVDIFSNTILCCFAILMITGVAFFVHETLDYIFNFCG